jgi:aminoglycoside 3-N-acetyltransferase
MLNFEDLTNGFRGLGLAQGDLLLVHSSYKSFGAMQGGPQAVIDALLEVLGESGTLVMPTFNFDFCKGEPFDVRSTASQMGIITELVRQMPRARRVFHPIYSFCAVGALADEIATLQNKSSYGADSLFAELMDHDGKIMIIGLSYNDSMTFFHYVEEMEGVDYRYLKDFTGKVINAEGQQATDTFQMLVRDWDRGVVTAVDPMGEVLEQEGVVRIRQIGEATAKLVRARDVYQITAREMKNDPRLLYRIESPEIARKS